MYYIYPTLFLEYIEMCLSGPFRFEGDLSISIPVYGEDSMYRTTLKPPVFQGTLKIGIIAAVLVLVCISPVFASTAAEPAVGWKYRGGWNNTGQYDDGNYHPIAKELWNFSGINHPSANIGLLQSTAAISNGILYFTDRDNDHLFAIYASNGSIRWVNTLTGGWTYSSPAVANGMVYVGTGDTSYNPGVFYAFNASDGGHGTPLWKKNLQGGVESSPTVANGIVYVGRDDGNLSAWNATTGADVWRYGTGDPVASSPAIADGRVYFSSSTNIFALNAITGAKVWDAANASGWDGSFGYNDLSPVSSPAVAYGNVYIAGSDAVYAFNASTGAQRPKFENSGGSFDGAPAVANGLVFIGTDGGPATEVFYALKANDLTTPVWQNSTPDNSDMVSSPAVANGVVYVISGGDLYAWNAATGVPRWTFTLPADNDGTTSSPVVSNGVVYFGTWWDGFFAVGSPKPSSHPVVTGVLPVKGPTSGGTVVTVTGTGFTGATAVRFGTTAGTSLTVNSSTKITIRSPAHAAGIVDVRVTTVGGTSTTSAADGFTYAALPTVTSISTASGPTSGGTTVIITGTGFTGATAVKFGTTPSFSASSSGSNNQDSKASGSILHVGSSGTQITVTSPAHAAGIVDVRVTTPGGTSAIVAGDKFTYMVP